MLKSVVVESNTKRKFDVGTRLIRAEAAFQAVVDGTGCKFTYPMNDRDRRERNTTIKISDTLANLVKDMDLGYYAVSIELPVYEDNDYNASTVTTDFCVTDIIWGAPYTPDEYVSWIWIQEGAFKVKKFLIDYSIDDIVTLAETGTT